MFEFRRIPSAFATVLFLLALAGTVSARNNTARDRPDPAAGRLYAAETCAPCHAIGPRARSSPLQAAPSFATIAAVPGMTATALFATLQTSHAQMPNLVLEDAQMRDVVAYILTLAPAKAP